MLYLICNRQKLISDCNLLGSFIHQLGIIWQLISTGHDLKAELFLHLTMTDAVLLSIVSYQPWKSSGLIWILDKRHSTLEVELLKRIPLPTREPPTQKKWYWATRGDDFQGWEETMLRRTASFIMMQKKFRF